MADYVNTGGIKATVKDDKGVVIVGANVTVTPTSGGTATSKLTGSDGTATFTVNIGGYTVSVSTTKVGVGSQPSSQSTTVTADVTNNLTFNY
ncbi:MAG: carboxypeptidase regulatory-like domain-containing protein [Bacteroidetes bacterium]|nr:carboxypeptidase regulatory-like domain-containing protein [Bacteroidota bacterium]